MLSAMLRHSTLLYVLFPCCDAMATFSTLFRHDYFLNAAVLRLLFPLCCTMTIFHAAVPCTLFPHCCAMATFLRCCAISTLSTMQRHVYFFHAAAPYLLFPRCCAVFSFPRCCAMSTFSTRLLRYDPLFHD